MNLEFNVIIILIFITKFIIPISYYYLHFLKFTLIKTAYAIVTLVGFINKMFS